MEVSIWKDTVSWDGVRYNIDLFLQYLKDKVHLTVSWGYIMRGNTLLMEEMPDYYRVTKEGEQILRDMSKESYILSNVLPYIKSVCCKNCRFYGEVSVKNDPDKLDIWCNGTLMVQKLKLRSKKGKQITLF